MLGETLESKPLAHAVVVAKLQEEPGPTGTATVSSAQIDIFLLNDDVVQVFQTKDTERLEAFMRIVVCEDEAFLLL